MLFFKNDHKGTNKILIMVEIWVILSNFTHNYLCG